MGLIFLISFRFGQAPAGQVVTPVGIAGQPLKGEPWKRLGDLEMDPVTAAQVEFHRAKAQSHLDQLETMRVDLAKAQAGKTAKAMPVPKPNSEELGSSPKREPQN